MPLTVTETTPPSASASCTLTSGSPAVTLADTSVIAGAVGVSGTGIPPGTFVASVDSATQITLTSNATATGAQTLTFALEPVTLAEAKRHLRVTFADDDADIASWITAARRYCATFEGVAVLNTGFLLEDDGFPAGGGGYLSRIDRQLYRMFAGPNGAVYPGTPAAGSGEVWLPRAPVVSVDSVQYYDSGNTLQTLSPSQYNATTGAPGRIAPAFGTVWPVTLPRIGAVKVAFTAGFGATADSVPATAKAAVRLVVGSLYYNRGDVAFDVVDAVRSLLAVESWGKYR